MNEQKNRGIIYLLKKKKKKKENAYVNICTCKYQYTYIFFCIQTILIYKNNILLCYTHNYFFLIYEKNKV